MMKRRRVLLVTTHWPPLNASGTMRVLGFARNLPAFGWDPEVLTVDHDLLGITPDHSLLARVPEGVPVHRVPVAAPASAITAFRRLRGRRATSSPGEAAGESPTGGARHRRLLPRLVDGYERWLLLGMRQLPWVPAALPRAIAAARRADALWATYPHWEPALLGLLTSRLTGRPLVVDFRDPGLHPRIDPLHSRLHRAWFTRLHRSVLDGARALVFTSEWMAGEYRDRFAPLPPSTVITNGLDGDMWEAPEPPGDDRFVLLLAGTIRSPSELDALIRAIDELHAARVITPDAFRFTVLSRQAAALGDRHAGRPARAYLDLHGVVPQAEATRLAGQATACLATQEETYAACIPAKIFQYLIHGRPLLVLCDRGATAELATRHRLGAVAPLSDAAAIARALGQLVSAWRRGGLEELYDPQAARHFDRQSLTAALARVLDDAVSVRFVGARV